MAKKELVLMITETGCIVPVSHNLNQDGYFRKRVIYNGRSCLMMYHRYKYLMAGNKIPEGYEVDHKCKNRACCNVEHLQCLPSTEHRSKGNAERYEDKQQMAREVWLVHNMTGTSLAKMFGVGISTACRWIRKWKDDD